MRKGKLFSGKAWKRIVRILSCIVVFCTTYALILPAITQEAQAYCGNMEHKHTEQCYKEIESCGREEHEHGEDCYDADGNLTCTLEEHTHSDECYRELLECTEEEHTHSLECFSDPEADKETEEDWKKTLPDEEALKDKSDTEKVLMIAESQKGYKESEKNYVVENETEKKGITRYGQWDEDPYEDWAGAYARFVLHYAGIETADAKKHVSDWLEQLHDKGELRAADEAEAGDVLFVYDEKDQLKAGIVSEVKDGTVKAWMGDWDNQVQEKTFSKTDEKVHSVWKAIQKEEPAEPKQPEGPAEPEVPAEEEQKPEEASKADEEKPAEQLKDEEPVVSYDFTQEVEAEDGAEIKVSWNAGTFETEDVVFQAKKVELTEEEQKKVQDQLDKDKSYTFRNYDLTFYVRDENMELQKVEPMQPIHVEIEFADENTADEKLPVFHFKDDGELEKLEKTKERLEATKDDSTRFKANSFSTYSFPMPLAETETNDEWMPCSDVNAVNTAINGGRKKILITKDLGGECVSIQNKGSINDPIYIDMNGYKFDGIIKPFYIKNSHVVITNRSSEKRGNYVEYFGTNFTEVESNDLSSYRKTLDDSNSNYQELHPLEKLKDDTVSTIHCNTGNNQIASILIEENSIVRLENIAVSKDNEPAVSVKKSKLIMEDSYAVNSKRGIQLADHSSLEMNGGAVSNNTSTEAGGGIYADGSSSIILGNNDKKTAPIISSNKGQRGGGIALGSNASLVMSNASIVGNIATGGEGGGIALLYNTNASAILSSGLIKGNITNKWEWGGGGIFASEGSYLWLPDGASIYNNESWGLGGGLTGCATGKILIDESLHIFDNKAKATHYASRDTSVKHKDHGYDEGYTDENNIHREAVYYNGGHFQEHGYKGEDVFGALLTETTGVFSDGQNANWQGVIDGNVISDTDGSTLYASDWTILKANPNNPDSLKNKSLKITGNSSTTHGGGVLINGWLVSGSRSTSSFGDYLSLRGKKGLTSVAGNSLSLDGHTFKFNVKNAQGSVVGTATNDSQGNLIFNSPIYVSGEGNYHKLTYTVEEDTSELPDNIIPGNDKWHLNVQLTRRSTETFYKPVWNPEKGVYESTSVEIVRYYISAVTYWKNDEQSATVYFGTNDNKQITLGSGNSFTNTKIATKTISVQKKWMDTVTDEDTTSSHDSDSVKVGLFYKKDVIPEPAEESQWGEDVTLNKENGWSYTWNNVQVTDQSGNPYKFSVKELDNLPGYITEVTSDEQQGTGSTTTVTETLDAWIPVTSTDEIVDGNQYIIVAPDANKQLLVSGNNLQNDHKVNSKDQQDIFSFVIKGAKLNGNDVKAYKTELNEGLLVTDSTFKIEGEDNRHVLGFGNNLWLCRDTGNNGLQILDSTNYGNSRFRGFYIYDGNLQVGYQYNSHGDLNYNNDTFGTTDQNGAGQKVQLYKRGTVKVTQTIETPAPPGQQTVTITNKKIINSLEITKTDTDTGETLAGAKFQLQDAAGSIIEKTTDNSGYIKFDNLSTGKYTLTEILPPDGYELPVEHSWVVEFTNQNQGQTQRIEVKSLTIGNTPIKYELPETGSAGTKIYTATGTILLLTGTSLYRYKRRRRRKGGEAH